MDASLAAGSKPSRYEPARPEPGFADDPVVARAREHGDAFGSVVALVVACSPYLGGLLAADPDRLDRFAATPPADAMAAIVARQRAVAARVRAGDLARAEAVAALRIAKADAALLIGLADVAGVWSVDDVVAALSDFADASVESAVGIALRDAEAAGALAPAEGADAGAGSGLTMLALGKHGAGELNYSSDVDLVAFFDPEAPRLRAKGEGARAYTRIVQSVAKLLGERTVDGYVHRVDYRLRPDPGSTPPAVSLPAAYIYYETLGQNWERAAMIKARPVAGDLDLGARFLRDLRPFIWRKYFDFGSIADIHAMKRQIHAVRGHGEIAVAGHDIKLGRGGIREIEFFVQTQQLVYGGRRPELRGSRTLEMLHALNRGAWISASARSELTDAYRFLRTVEHRLQMVADEQTHRMPTDAAELERLARFCGFPSLPDLASALTGHAERVQGHYALLFEDAPDLASDFGDLVFAGPSADPETVETVRRLGFREPEKAVETVRGWHFGRRAAVTSARAREVLTELVPSLLTALGGSADPDAGLAHLDRAFARMPAAVELLTTLRSRESLRLLFADLLGSAPRLADTVAATPHVLDAMLAPGPAPDVPETEEAVGAEFRALLGQPPSMEEFLDGVRDAVRYLQFSAGARMLSGQVAAAEAGRLHAAIADAAIRASLARATDAFAAEHGHVPGGRMAVLGFGRLGARNLTASSDLDLVVVYDFHPERRTSDGPRPLDAAVYHLRLAQRLVAALTVPTRRGRLYDVDLRLRPSGAKGPIAAQFSGFGAYYATDAEPWEHMALTRARIVAGEPGLAGEIEEAVRTVLTTRRDPRAVYLAVAAMRDLVEREKGSAGEWDMKLAPGGLLDVEFLAQALVLAHAADAPSLLGLPTDRALTEAGRLALLDPGIAADLAEAHRKLDDVLHWQRLTVGRQEGEPTAPTLRRLSALTGAPDEARLRGGLADLRREVRATFDRVLRPSA